MNLGRDMGKALALLAIGVLFAVGCSSGGGGGGSVDDLQITNQNAGDVAKAAYEAQEGLGGAADFTGNTGVFAKAGRSAGTGLAGRVMTLLQRHVLRDTKFRQPADFGCSGGGSVDLGGTDAPPPGLSSGDSISFDFTGCSEAGETIDGRITMTINTIIGDPANSAFDWSLSITVTFDDLTVTGASNSFADGSFAFSVSWDAATMSSTATLTGSNLTLIEDGEAVDVSGNFTFTITVDDNSGNYTINLSMSAVVNGGQVSLTTPTPLTGSGENPPDEGVLLITGAGNSSISLTFTGAGNVTVEVDQNGDDAADCTQFLTVDTLEQFDPTLCS